MPHESFFLIASQSDFNQVFPMKNLRIRSASEQLAEYLKEEICAGRWTENMPGETWLVTHLHLGRETVRAALAQLEKEKLLVGQGAGRRRKITLPDKPKSPSLRVCVLLMEMYDRSVQYMLDLEHGLAEAGHTVFLAPKTLSDLGMDVLRVARMVEKTEADAWVVVAASRDVLEWFAARKTPVIAMFGRRQGVRIASVGPNKIPVISYVTRKLISLGHRRIVMLGRSVRRLPKPGEVEQAFLDELSAHGIVTGSYNFPDWEESVDGFYARLDSLFRVSAPTALIVDEVPFFLAVQQFLAERKIRVPNDVSLVCTDASKDFDWCRPKASHICWDHRPVVRRVVRWAANVAHGKEDLRQTNTKAEFMLGGTIGVAKD